MPFPAARLTDMTVSADPITAPGVPTVLIGGLPASVVTDAVSGPVIVGVITTGNFQVLIGGRPAARMTSTVVGVNTITGVPLTLPIMVVKQVTVLV